MHIGKLPSLKEQAIILPTGKVNNKNPKIFHYIIIMTYFTYVDDNSEQEVDTITDTNEKKKIKSQK